MMGGLRCTLCCGETFGTTEELKSHLKNILENIVCSCCSLKFCSLQKLLEHYSVLSNQETQFLDSFPKEEIPDYCIQDSSEHLLQSPTEEDLIIPPADEQPGIQQCLEKDVEIHTSDDTKPSGEISGRMLGELTDVKDEECDGGRNSKEDTLFQCSCGMMFSSLVEHVMIYHTGEEVIVKGDIEHLESLLDKKPDGNSKDPQVEVASNSVVSAAPESHHEEEPEVIVCDRDDDNKGVAKAEQSVPLTSLQIDQLDGKVEECVDKDGRLYLRKFVRVKKFWSEKDEINAAQMKAKVRNFESVRDVPVGSVSIKSKDEAVSASQSGQPKKLFQCNKCQKNFQTMIHFRYHVCTLKNGSATTCNLCGHESTSTKDLRAHWRMHQRQRRAAATALWEMQAGEGASTNGNGCGDEVEELQCDRCGEMYKKSEELVHIAMHDEEPPFNCQKCDESFESSEKLGDHMRSHREQKINCCIYCGKTFTDSNAYKLHVRSHTGEKPYECQYCGKMFSRPYERMKHERIHTGERPHVCEICGKTFRVSYCLTLHKRTHSGDRPYSCDTCGKRFKAHSAYKHHIQIHSEERNYKCPYCPKAFKTMVHLSGHKKTHTKPFLCTECNRRFASLYSVKAHIESHKTGKNSFRYRCFVCGASYARSFALHAHLLTHGPCDAPEDVAEVLEICEEVEKKDENDLDMAEFLGKKSDHSNQSNCEDSIKIETHR